MALFNRTRTRVLSTHNMELDQLYNTNFMLPVPCKHVVQKTYSVAVKKEERIDDFVPVGKFHPGNFKITNVRRFSVEPEWGGAIDAPIYFADYTRCWVRKLVGNPGPDLLGLPAYPLFLSPVTIPPTLVRDLGMQAAGKAQKPSLGLGESFAEGGATLQMMRNPFSGMRKILQRVFLNRRGKRRNFADASSAWLEYRYGWTPLYNTVKDAFEQHPVVPDALYNARASESDSTSVDTDKGWFRATSRIPWCLRARRSVVTETKYRFQRYYRITDPALYRGFQRGGTLFQVPTLLWELVPLSFAVDWWLGVGDWLYALTPNPSIKILGNTLSVLKEETDTVFTTHAAYPFPFTNDAKWVSPANTHFSWKRKFYYREVVDPILAQPTLSLGYESWKHGVDALALITQRGVSLITRKH